MKVEFTVTGSAQESVELPDHFKADDIRAALLAWITRKVEHGWQIEGNVW